MKHAEKFRSPLSRARGLGAAKSGTEHFWLQRLTALALIPLVFTFVVFVIQLTGDPQTEVASFIGRPFPAAITMLLVIALFWHFKLGGQVILEDYVHHEPSKLLCVALLNFFCFGLGLASVLAVVRLVAIGV